VFATKTGDRLLAIPFTISIDASLTAVAFGSAEDVVVAKFCCIISTYFSMHALTAVIIPLDQDV
jgi:hypothetical protein